MDYSEITNLISCVGFPIIACVFMYKQYISTLDKISELSQAIIEVKMALQSNTEIINRICEKWGV